MGGGLENFESNILPCVVDEWSPSNDTDPEHRHKNLEIGYCISGKGWFYFGEKTYKVSPGDIFIVNNLEHHCAQSDKSNPSKYLFLYFDPSITTNWEKELLLPFVYRPKAFINKISHKHPVAQRIGSLIKMILKEQINEKIGYRSMMRNLLFHICTLLLRHYNCDEEYSKEFSKVYEQYSKLQPAIEYMHHNFSDNIELDDISKELNLSPSRTRQLFKEIMGEGFKEYLTQLRINEAKVMLSGTNKTVTEICLLCGFQNLSPFYRAFNKLVGMTPHEYRKETTSVLYMERKDEVNIS